jgi:RNA ligase-like protein
MLHSYPSIFNLGHKAVKTLFDTEVLIEEKVDGSQFSFGKRDGVLFMRSKEATLYEPVTDKLFRAAAEYVISIKDKLQEGWTYRGEVLCRPKHNSLEYERTPQNNVIIFDIDRGDQDYLTSVEKYVEAGKLGFEVVPVLYEGKINNYEDLKKFFERVSVLGKANIEGMVIKAYTQFGQDKKVLMGKWVSEAFKEVHSKEWGASNPTKSDLISSLVKALKTDARWEKAIQHLRDDGKLEESPRDIGNLLKEIQTDVKKEVGDEIKEKLFAYYWPQIARGVVGGFPEYYKDRLAKSQFAPQEVSNVQA